MRIVHVIIACFYKEGLGYQENILPLKHKELGYDVSIITFCSGQNIVDSKNDYINKDGIPVYVLKENDSFLHKMSYIGSYTYRTVGLYAKLCDLKPDIIFVHGLQTKDTLLVYKYKKRNPNVKIYIDQHADYYNTPVKTIGSKLYSKIFLRGIAKKIESSVERFWGVTSWRVKYLNDIYKISKEKIGLLVMGGDENKIDWENRFELRSKIREKYKIPQDAFLIVTGGKIDKTKNIHLLMEAVSKLNNVYLLVFGSFDEEMQSVCEKYLSERIINLGWVQSDEVYPYFLSSDLGVFPGTHSVLWEQACASGLPCLFKNWQGGVDHLDVGGNCELLNEISVEVLYDKIGKLSVDKEAFEMMKSIASKKARKEFSYIEIAKKSIGII